MHSFFKSILYTLILCFVVPSFGQDRPTAIKMNPFSNKYIDATVNLRNGESYKGMAKIRENLAHSVVLFKKEEKSKKQKFGYREIESVVFLHDDYEEIHVFKMLKNPSKPHSFNPILVRLVPNERISLYKRSDISIGPNLLIPSGNISFGSSPSDYVYFYSENDDDFVSQVPLGTRSDAFKKFAINTFEGCYILVQKVIDKEFKNRETEEVFKYYEEDCQRP